MSDEATIVSTCTAQTWMPVVTAFLGAGLTLLGVSLTNRTQRLNQERQIKHQEKTEARITRRDKLEELYELTLHLYDIITRKHSLFSKAVQNNLTYELVLQLAAPSNELQDPIPRMQVLVNLYFSDMSDVFRELSKHVTGFRQIELQIHEAYNQGNALNNNTVEDLDIQQRNILEKTLRLRERIVLSAEELYKLKANS